MSSWLNFADDNESIDDQSSPYLGFYTMKPSVIAKNLERPQSPFVPKGNFPIPSNDFSTIHNIDPIDLPIGLNLPPALVI